MQKTKSTRPAAARSTRAQPEPLSRERIVQAALEEVEAGGLASLSMRKVAQRLGREAMSLYHHFPSKQHLLDALVEHAIGSVVVAEPGPDAQARIRASIESYRAMARRWPALFPLVAVHRLNTPAGVRFIESILRLIHATTGDAELTARHFRAMGYYLIGACLEETAGYARGPSAAEPVDDAFIARECPHLVQAAPYFQASHWDATWQLGLDALLERAARDRDALAARPASSASARRAAGPPARKAAKKRRTSGS